MKTIRVAFVFLAVIAITGCSDTKPSVESQHDLAPQIQADPITQPQISVVTARQIKAMDAALAEGKKIGDNANSITEIPKNLRTVDISDCPKDFQQAYIDNIAGWDELVDVEAKYDQFNQKYNSYAATFEAIVRGLVLDDGMYAEMHDDKAKIDDLRAQAVADIRKSYSQLQHIALAAGVDVSPYK